MDKSKFLQFITILAEVYDKELSQATIDIYYRLLSDYTADEFERAILYIMRTRKYSSFPKPAEIIENIAGTISDKAQLAWSSLLRTIISVGNYKSVEFEDKTIHVCVESMGGWQTVALSEKKDIPFVERKFCELYELYSRHNGTVTAPPVMLGLFDATNGKNGFKQDKPVYISDVSKQHNVLTKKTA